jgi:hypothetical protein
MEQVILLAQAEGNNRDKIQELEGNTYDNWEQLKKVVDDSGFDGEAVEYYPISFFLELVNNSELDNLTNSFITNVFIKQA